DGYLRNAAAINAALTPRQGRQLEINAVGVQTRWKAGNRNAAALDAVEAYRTLVSAVNRDAMPVPLEVSLLDYVGFRLNVLLGDGQAPNWTAITHTVGEAHGFWQAIKPKVKDPRLVDGMDRSLQACAAAVRQRNPGMLGYAADIDLILVDGLENHLQATPAN